MWKFRHPGNWGVGHKASKQEGSRHGTCVVTPVRVEVRGQLCGRVSHLPPRGVLERGSRSLAVAASSFTRRDISLTLGLILNSFISKTKNSQNEPWFPHLGGDLPAVWKPLLLFYKYLLCFTQGKRKRLVHDRIHTIHALLTKGNGW